MKPKIFSQDIRTALQDFARNNRWGSCEDCPKDGNGRKLPELCQYTTRFDHQLDWDFLDYRVRLQSVVNHTVNLPMQSWEKLRTAFKKNKAGLVTATEQIQFRDQSFLSFDFRCIRGEYNRGRFIVLVKHLSSGEPDELTTLECEWNLHDRNLNFEVNGTPYVVDFR